MPVGTLYMRGRNGMKICLGVKRRALPYSSSLQGTQLEKIAKNKSVERIKPLAAIFSRN